MVRLSEGEAKGPPPLPPTLPSPPVVVEEEEVERDELVAWLSPPDTTLVVMVEEDEEVVKPDLRIQIRQNYFLCSFLEVPSLTTGNFFHNYLMN